MVGPTQNYDMDPNNMCYQNNVFNNTTSIPLSLMGLRFQFLIGISTHFSYQYTYRLPMGASGTLIAS